MVKIASCWQTSKQDKAKAQKLLQICREIEIN